MKKKEYKEVTTRKEVVTEVICDICEKEIRLKDGYFHVTTRHHHWGNDSIDSIEFHEFCSFDCMKTHLEEYYGDPEPTEDYDISFVDGI